MMRIVCTEGVGGPSKDLSYPDTDNVPIAELLAMLAHSSYMTDAERGVQAYGDVTVTLDIKELRPVPAEKQTADGLPVN